ncbi:MAG: methyltransferase domain-containing protein, partial [Candidatus Bathyarchaeia archaeon]
MIEHMAPLRAFEPAEALRQIRKLVDAIGDEKVLHSFYLEYVRRLLTLRIIREACPQCGSLIVDLGASPFIVSCALKCMGYNVIAVDLDPMKYISLASQYGVKVIKADLERDKLSLPDEQADCVLLAEVLEHLNPYYVSHVMSEINRVLKPGGKLILTTPNIASLFRRIRLLLGIQPQYTRHVHEYTKREVEELLMKHGFRMLRINYSE